MRNCFILLFAWLTACNTGGLGFGMAPSDGRTIVDLGNESIRDMTPALKSCNVSDAVDIGPGIVPRIAATPNTYGLAYLQHWGDSRLFRAINPAGQDVNMPTTLPSRPDDFPQIIGVKDGYLVHASGDTAPRDKAWSVHSFFFFDGSGKLQSAIQNVGNMPWVTAAALDTGGARLAWQPSGGRPTTMKCDSTTQMMRAELTRDGMLTLPAPFYCPLNDGPFDPFQIGLAAAGYSSLAGLVWSGLGYQAAKVVLFGAKGADVFTLGNPTNDPMRSIGINTIGRRQNDFFAIWTEFRWGKDGIPTVPTTHLTIFEFVNGRHDYLIPPVFKVVWDGKNFGAVGYDEPNHQIIFYLLGPEGQLQWKKVIYEKVLHYESFPEIAAGDGFGIVASRQDDGGIETLVYLHVACK